MNRRILGLVAAAAFVGSVVLANFLTSTFGFIPVGFGLTATAGTLVAGFALALRDVVQDSLGRLVVTAAIIIGATVSGLVAAPAIALASAVAFLISELADFAVYTPLRRRARFGDHRWTGAVLASNLVGAIVDTVIFVGIAFGFAIVLNALPGQLVGKAWATLLFLLIGWAARALLRKPQH